MQPVTDHTLIDKVDRERWAVAAAATLVHVLSPETLQTIVACGEDEFLKHAARVYETQDFRQSDLQAIFARLTHKADQIQSARVHG